MDEYSEMHQLVRKRCETFESLAHRNAEALKIHNTHTSQPWSRNLSKSNVALNVVPNTTSSRLTTINTKSDSVFINSSERNKNNIYGNNCRNFKRNGIKAEKENEFEVNEKIVDKISASEYIDDRGPNEVQGERWSKEDDVSDSFHSEEEGQGYEVTTLPPSILLNIGNAHHVLEEIIATEGDYVKNLHNGMENYVTYMENNLTLPQELKRKNQIFGVIEKIYEFHRNQFHPALLQANYDLDVIIEKFRFFIQHDHFYLYVLYAMNKPKTDAIVHQNEQFFNDRQNGIGDKLGVSSFLMQPIQRLPKYRLLIHQMINEIMKNIDKIKNNSKLKTTLGNLCLAEKEVQKVLDIVNDSIKVNDIQFDEIFISIRQQGKFIRCGEFEIQDHSKTKNKYRGKIFLFSKALIYTEHRTPNDKQLMYRGSYDRTKMGLRYDESESCKTNKKKFFIFESKMGQNEVEFNRTDDNHDNWYALLQQILAEEERNQVKMNEYLVPKMQINDSSSTTSEPIASDYISNYSNRCSADSFEFDNSSWEEHTNSDKLCNSEMCYINCLQACRKAYNEQITDDDQKRRNIKFKKGIDEIYNFHRNFLLPKIVDCGTNYEDIMRLFQMVYDAGKFDLYIKYSMVTNIGNDILKDLFPLGSNSTSNSYDIASSLYVNLPVYRIKYYLSLIDSYISENKGINNWNTDVFKMVAILQSNLLKLQKKVEETFKLYAIRQTSVRLPLYGSCEYSDLVSIDNFGTLKHRFCIMEDGLILVKIKTNADTQEEYFKEIVFNLPYWYGLNMRGSKKNANKISFDIDSQKSAVPGIIFRTLEKCEAFKNILCNVKKIGQV